VRAATGSVSRQLALTVSLAIVPVLVTLIAFTVVMVTSDGAGLWVVGVTALAGLISIGGAQLVSRQIVTDVERIRIGVQQVARGSREIRITTAADDELRRLADSVNALIVHLGKEEEARRQSDAARRDLVAAISHDLRTPITSLRLLADSIGDELVRGDERRAYADRMATHIRSLSALIDDLFELSRLEAGDITWSLQQVPLDELVGETVEAMRAQADAKGVKVLATLPPSLAPAHANPEKLQRVLFNLIQNAIRHTPADGAVVVRAEATPGGVEIEVADTGTGIAPGDRGRVFTAFYRGGDGGARSTSDSGGGAGLGLAVSRAIVEAHGGRIWLGDSERGTSVHFTLPAIG